MKKGHTIQLVISILCILIVGTAAFFLHKYIFAGKGVVKDLEVEFQKEDARRLEIKNLERSVKNLELERNKLESYFARNSDVVPFLNTLESLAQEVGGTAEVSTVKVVESEPAFFVDLKVEGSFNAIYRFILLLENAPYEIEIISFDMQSANISTSIKSLNPKWAMSLKLKLVSFILD